MSCTATSSRAGARDEDRLARLRRRGHRDRRAGQQPRGRPRGGARARARGGGRRRRRGQAPDLRSALVRAPGQRGADGADGALPAGRRGHRPRPRPGARRRVSPSSRRRSTCRAWSCSSRWWTPTRSPRATTTCRNCSSASPRPRKPMVVSTGMSDLAGIRAAKEVVERRWAALGHDGELAILHCVSAYPAPRRARRARDDPDAGGRAAASPSATPTTRSASTPASPRSPRARGCWRSTSRCATTTPSSATTSSRRSPTTCRSLVERVRAVEALLGTGAKQPQLSERAAVGPAPLDRRGRRPAGRSRAERGRPHLGATGWRPAAGRGGPPARQATPPRAHRGTSARPAVVGRYGT